MQTAAKDGPAMPEYFGKVLGRIWNNPSYQGEAMPLGSEEILNRFGFHKATIEGKNATAPKHADLRAEFIKFASMLDVVLPDGRYKDLVLEELEDVSMWAHKSIAQTAPLLTEKLTCEDKDDSCFGEVERWFIYPDDINSFVHCEYHKRKRAARSRFLICEEVSVDCFGTVRHWFIYPDQSTPHLLCEAHIGAKKVRAISPDVVTPNTVVNFDLGGSLESEPDAPVDLGNIPSVLNIKDGSDLPKTSMLETPNMHKQRDGRLVGSTFTLIVQQPGDPTVTQALREEEAKLLPESEEYDADAYNLGNAGLD